MMDSGSMMSDSQNATIRDLEEKCRRLQANQQVREIKKVHNGYICNKNCPNFIQNLLILPKNRV